MTPHLNCILEQLSRWGKIKALVLSDMNMLWEPLFVAEVKRRYRFHERRLDGVIWC